MPSVCICQPTDLALIITQHWKLNWNDGPCQSFFCSSVAWPLLKVMTHDPLWGVPEGAQGSHSILWVTGLDTHRNKIHSHTFLRSCALFFNELLNCIITMIMIIFSLSYSFLFVHFTDFSDFYFLFYLQLILIISSDFLIIINHLSQWYIFVYFQCFYFVGWHFKIKVFIDN